MLHPSPKKYAAMGWRFIWFVPGRLPSPAKDVQFWTKAPIDKSFLRLYKDLMKTLTITDAKKNLGRWLDAAARGQNIGIICGGDIIALRKVEVESTDYAQREYGATEEQIAALEEATEKRYRRLKRSGKLATVTTEQLRKILE